MHLIPGYPLYSHSEMYERKWLVAQQHSVRYHGAVVLKHSLSRFVDDPPEAPGEVVKGQGCWRLECKNLKGQKSDATAVFQNGGNGCGT